MSNIEQMLNKIEEKCLLSTYVTDSDNVQAGETYHKVRLPDSSFPRLEYNIHGEDNYSYVCQKTIEPIHYFDVSGYLRTSTYTQTKSKLIEAALFGRETVKNIFGINNDHLLKVDGVELIDGFVNIHPLYHLNIYQETDNKHTSFRFVFAMIVGRRWDDE